MGAFFTDADAEAGVDGGATNGCLASSSSSELEPSSSSSSELESSSKSFNVCLSSLENAHRRLLGQNPISMAFLNL